MGVENKVPAIRFKGFSGEWVERKLETIFNKIRNAFVGTATPYYVKSGNFYLESNNVKNGKINRSTEVFINDEFYHKQSDKWLRTGDIVMVQSGHVGHTAVIPPELNNIAAHALIMFTDKKEEISPHFLNFQFQTIKSKNKLSEITTGNTIKHILSSEMKEFHVSLPHFKEQDIVGNYFQQLDTLIAQHQKKHDKLLNLKKALLEKMLPKQGATVPEIRFKGFSAEWEKKVLGDIGYFKSGGGFPEIEQNGQAGIPYFKVSDMNIDGNQVVMIFANNYVNEEQIARLNYKPIGERSIIFAKVGAAIFLERKRVAEKFLIDNNMMAFSPIEDVGFIKLWFDSIELSKYAQVGALPSYNASDLKVIELCVPQKEEQTQIGNLFQQLDTLITQHQAQLTKLGNIKQACLEKMFI